jgi:DNA ligase-1
MSYRDPMLAAPLKGLEIAPGQYQAEEKFDGHRLIAEVGEATDLFGQFGQVKGWSRNAIERPLPPHIRRGLADLPLGTYDGELLVPGTQSFGVTVLENSGQLVYTVFDVLELLGNSTEHFTYLERRALLEKTFATLKPCMGVALAKSFPVNTMDEVLVMRDDVWSRGGEGLILKHVASTYTCGKRSKMWRKIKKLQTAVLRVIAYREGELGPHSVLLLEDPEGNQTTVKWKNYKELERLDAYPDSFLGKELRIEFQDRTPDGSYRHPRWDRWEDE